MYLQLLLYIGVRSAELRQKMKYKSLVDFHSSGIESLVNGWLMPDVSGRVGFIFKSRMSSEGLFSPWSWGHHAVPKCRVPATKRNIAEDRRLELQRKGNLITHKYQVCLKIGCWREWAHDKSDLRIEKTAQWGISWFVRLSKYFEGKIWADETYGDMYHA